MNDQNKNIILEIKKLSKHFGSVIAVDNICLNIGDGEFITLLGPSGSGKTTLLNMIAGFEFPTSGEIILQNKSISRILPEKRNIGMVFQNYALFPHMTIFDNVAFALRIRKYSKSKCKEKVKKAMELVQLQGYEDRKPNQLSGGQQQRIALARAIVFDPPLLLLDEPLGALDKKLREHMQIELKQLHTKLKKTMIYVTHDQEEALIMSDRVAVINHGKIVQVGTPNELYDKPANEFVAGFIGESNILRGHISEKKDNFLTFYTVNNTKLKFYWDGNIINDKDVSFCIRPEKIFFIDNNDSKWSIDGVIEEVLYVGETKRYTIRISNEETINLREMNIKIDKGRTVGERVKIAWFNESLNIIYSDN